jgi:hypothetical protein
MTLNSAPPALVPPENDGVWVVTRHEHIGEVSRNPEIYCSSKARKEGRRPGGHAPVVVDPDR